jgi:hypothetical protein
MVFEELCEVCGRYTQIKFCKIRNIKVCYECCINCNKRNNCEARVWFKPLIPSKKLRGEKGQIRI